MGRFSSIYIIIHTNYVLEVISLNDDEKYTLKEVITDLKKSLDSDKLMIYEHDKKIKLLETKLDQIYQSLKSRKSWIWNFIAILIAGIISSFISLL